MAGHPDPDNRSVGLDLILVGSGHPDIRRLDYGGGLGNHNGSGLRNHHGSRRNHHGSGLGNHHRTRHDRIMDYSSHDPADDTPDKSASAVMVVAMVVTVMAGTAVRTGKARSGAKSDRKNQNCRFHLVHILPFLSPPFGVTLG